MNELIEVIWLDACQREFTLQEIDELDTETILVTQKTYGKLIAMNNDLILLEHEEDNYDREEKECSAIPRSWILKPRRLKK